MKKISPISLPFLKIILLIIFFFLVLFFTWVVKLAFPKLSAFTFYSLCFLLILIIIMLYHNIHMLAKIQVKKDTLIIKKSRKKTQLIPLDIPHFKTLIKNRFFALTKIYFVIDGRSETALVVTNLKLLKKIKKKQAISRVL